MRRRTSVNGRGDIASSNQGPYDMAYPRKTKLQGYLSAALLVYVCFCARATTVHVAATTGYSAAIAAAAPGAGSLATVASSRRRYVAPAGRGAGAPRAGWEAHK
eukprot:GHVU01194268.1.p1 GENE.GHVU01194268.1~~GHVU01194268.1.p1  ORF type:complete len:104 (+),score=4.64 GHVU01194268.1:232-543(+)